MWANNLRVFSAFAVVMLHVAVGFVGGIDLSDSSYGSRDWWAGNIYDSVTKTGLDQGLITLFDQRQK
jgi:surface polysaccharide O-acyltransferase-like enzyme